MRRVLALAGCFTVAACGASPDEARPIVVGQWIWSSTDARVFERTRQDRQALRAAVWIGSIQREGTRVVAQLGVAPGGVEDSTATWVVRLEDSMHPLVDSLGQDSLAALVAPHLRNLLTSAERDGRRHRLQLDYDAPTRLLPRWAALLGVLRHVPLQGREVWITSLLVHTEHPQYGALFREVVDGYVLQLFDTQVEYTPAMTQRVERAVRRGEMPAAIGLGAYERTYRNGVPSEHRAWFQWTAGAVRAGTIREVWIFAAGREYLPLLQSVGL